MLRIVIFFSGKHFHPSKKTFQTKSESFSVPNLDLSEKSGKVVIKQDKF